MVTVVGVHDPGWRDRGPDGRDPTASGGWAFRDGPETVAGDKFRLGDALEGGALLFGRRTWRRSRGRDDPFAQVMNRIGRLVVSRSLTDVSSLLTGIAAGIQRRSRPPHDRLSGRP
jgi:hypothetical protein